MSRRKLDLMGRTGESGMDRWFKRLSRSGFLVQPVAGGLLPALYAATSPQTAGGAFYGPGGPGHLTGRPVQQSIYRSARSEADARRLWEVSERLARVEFAAV